MFELILEFDLESQSRLSAFFWEKIIFDFFLQKGNIVFVTFTHLYRKYHISMCFLRNIIFHFLSKETISYFSEKSTIFSDYTKKIMFQHNFFLKDHLFGAFEKNIIFPFTILTKIMFHFPSKEHDDIFGEKKINFPDNKTRNMTFQCDFFGKTIFSEYLKKI